MPIFWCWFSFFSPIIMIISDFILAIEYVLMFEHWYRSWNPQHGGQGWSGILAISQKMKTTACQVDKNGRLALQEEAYVQNQKHCCLCPLIEYYGVSVPFCYYSLLGRVIDFPSRVRVVKKIPSTGRVASTRHSLLLIRMRNIHIGVKMLLAINLFISLFNLFMPSIFL